MLRAQNRRTVWLIRKIGNSLTQPWVCLGIAWPLPGNLKSLKFWETSEWRFLTTATSRAAFWVIAGARSMAGIRGGTSLREQLKLKLAPSLVCRPQRNSFCPTGTLRSRLITMNLEVGPTRPHFLLLQNVQEDSCAPRFRITSAKLSPWETVRDALAAIASGLPTEVRPGGWARKTSENACGVL